MNILLNFCSKCVVTLLVATLFLACGREEEVLNDSQHAIEAQLSMVCDQEPGGASQCTKDDVNGKIAVFSITNEPGTIILHREWKKIECVDPEEDSRLSLCTANFAPESSKLYPVQESDDQPKVLYRVKTFISVAHKMDGVIRSNDLIFRTLNQRTGAFETGKTIDLKKNQKVKVDFSGVGARGQGATRSGWFIQ